MCITLCAYLQSMCLLPPPSTCTASLTVNNNKWKKKSSTGFSLPFSPPPLCLFLPSFSEMRRDGLSSAGAMVALLSAWAAYCCCVSGWTAPIMLSPWCTDVMGKLWWIHCGGNKAWRPTDLTPLSSWYQTCQTQTSQSAGSNKQHIQNLCRVHQRLPINWSTWN